MSFVQRLEQGETMTELCREYGISRKTGYKLRERFRELGPMGLYDQSRAPERIPHKTREEIVELLVEARKKHPTWGGKKLRARLMKEQPGIEMPAPSTIADILKRKGLVECRKRRRGTPPYEAPLRKAKAPHDVWCADFKGQFRLGNGKLCYPLTITDRYSRMILCCEALESTNVESALAVFDKTFREHGLPRVIRTDNGVPFATRGLLGLSPLSVRWLRLGVWPERIALAHPEQNGQHERMHLVLKQETTRPSAANMLAQQERFDRFVHEYNHERPHEALEQRTPDSVYRLSSRRYDGRPPTLEYPLDDMVLKVDASGHVRFPKQRVFLMSALRGEHVGVRELADSTWLVSYAGRSLGTVDLRTTLFEPGDALFTEGQDTND
jgi:putative transposase